METGNLILGTAGAIGQEVINTVGKSTIIGTGLQNAIGASTPAQAGAMLANVLHPIILAHPLITIGVVGLGLVTAAFHFGEPLSDDDFESDEDWMGYLNAHQL